MMVPIRLEGDVLGIVQVQAHDPGAYTEDDLRLLEAMVLQMAAAERNAFLYRQVHEKLEERTRTETELREKQAEIEALNERLRRSVVETHHRVKNNLQVIAAMIDMYLLDDLESIPRSELERMGGHIITLGLVHDLLTADARQEGFAATLSADQMVSALLQLMRRVARHMKIEQNLEPAVIPVRQATSVALIVNELVSNAFKHGETRVNVELSWVGSELRIQVSDDGPGFPPGFAPALQGHTGIDLVEHICMLDLSGRTEYGNNENGGARVRIEFPASVGD
jgi:two-component sensor histidine kinase